MLTKVPEDMREGLRQLFIKTQQEAAEAIAKASSMRSRNIAGLITIDPHDYTKAVLGENPTLATKLELIALSVHYLKPDALDLAKEKYSGDFEKFKGIDFMKIIAATDVKLWKSQRDVGDKMLKELQPLMEKSINVPEEAGEASDEVSDEVLLPTQTTTEVAEVTEQKPEVETVETEEAELTTTTRKKK
jgi:hypothetical protein